MSTNRQFASDRLITAQELVQLPTDDQRCELIRGVVRVMSPAGGRHGRIALKLARRIGNHVEEHRLGETFAAETGFLISQNPDTVRAPDVAFVCSKRLSAITDETGYLPFAPDLVAEVLSPSDRWSDVEAKVSDWIDSGTQIVLVVDPANHCVHFNQPGEQTPVQSLSQAHGKLDLSTVITGFALDIDELFEHA